MTILVNKPQIHKSLRYFSSLKYCERCDVMFQFQCSSHLLFFQICCGIEMWHIVYRKMTFAKASLNSFTVVEAKPGQEIASRNELVLIVSSKLACGSTEKFPFILRISYGETLYFLSSLSLECFVRLDLE